MTDTTDKPTASEALESLTGFEEIAIARAFKADIADLKRKPFTFLRALCFAIDRRRGVKDAEAYKYALSLTIGQVNETFADEPDDDQDNEDGDLDDQDDELAPDEDDDLDLDTPAGKGDVPPGF